MRWFGTAEEIMTLARQSEPEIDAAMQRVRELVPAYKREISPYQGAALFVLARRYGKPGARILEIGTAWGYSAALMALAAPQAQIITLNPKDGECEKAQQHLASLENVTVLKQRSEDYLAEAQTGVFDMIFDDGDHRHVAANLPYFDLLRHDGLMLWHDYSAPGSWRPCPPVREVIDLICAARGQDDPDLLVMDDGGVGMAGLYRRYHETWRAWNIAPDFAPWHVQYPERVWVRSDD